MMKENSRSQWSGPARFQILVIELPERVNGRLTSPEDNTT